MPMTERERHRREIDRGHPQRSGFSQAGHPVQGHHARPGATRGCFPAPLILLDEPFPTRRELTRWWALTRAGFIFAAAAAYKLKCGFVPVRKKGKLPYLTYEQSYDLEYGSNTIAIHSDAIKPGSRVVLVDDLLATGGTAGAAAGLLQRLGVRILEVTFLIELSFLKGREKLQGFSVRSLIVY